MRLDGETRGPKIGHPVTVAILVVSLALNAVLLGRMFWTKDRVAEASRARPEARDPIAGESPSRPPAEPGGTNTAGDGRNAAPGSSRRDWETTLSPGYGRRPGDTERWSSRAKAPLAAAPRPERGGAIGASQDVVPAAGSPSVVPGAASAPQPASASPVRSPDSRARNGGAPTYGLPGTSAPAAEEGSKSDTPKTPVEADPTSDRTPPVLQSLGFDPREVAGGSATTLLVQVSDDLSGVKSVWGMLRSASGAAMLQFGPQGQSDGNLTAFRISIPAEAETGVWYVSMLDLTDQAGNSDVQRYTAATVPAGGTLRVVSSESDSTAPEVLQIWVEKASVDGGEKNAVRIEARDDRSGVASIMGFFQNPTKSAQIWFTCALNEGSGYWEGSVPVPANADCGEWTLQYLKAVDNAGNIAYLQGNVPPMAGVGFRVSGGTDCDSSPPTLEAFELSPTVVSNQAATEILITATVRDVGTGAVSMTGWFEGPVSTSGETPKNYFFCSPNRSNPDAPWTGKIMVPQYAPKGTWKVGTIRLQDKALNFRQYSSADPVVAGVVFEVQ